MDRHARNFRANLNRARRIAATLLPEMTRSQAQRTWLRAVQASTAALRWATGPHDYAEAETVHQHLQTTFTQWEREHQGWLAQQLRDVRQWVREASFAAKRRA